MACGRPVVASDWDGYRELIGHGETGFKVRTEWADCLGGLDELAPTLGWDPQYPNASPHHSLTGSGADALDGEDIRDALDDADEGGELAQVGHVHHEIEDGGAVLHGADV